MSERYAIGIDLGGSKLRGGLLSQDGQLVARFERAARKLDVWKLLTRPYILFHRLTSGNVSPNIGALLIDSRSVASF